MATIIDFKNFIKRHKFAIFIFIFMYIYNFIIVNNFSLPAIDKITYTFHIVDFSIGFCSKLLPGAIYNAFFSTTEAEMVNIYFNIIYHIFLLIVAFMLEVFLERFSGQERTIAFIIVMVFITGPATFSIHTLELGMLDTYWLFFTVLFLIFIQNKIFRWFVPILFALSLLIHFSAIISFIPLFALIILLEASRTQNDRKIYLIIFIVSVIITVLLFCYLVIYEKENLTVNLDEFRAFINQRNKSSWEDYNLYYDFAFFGASSESQMPNYVLIEGESPVHRFINSVWTQLCITFKMRKLGREYLTESINDVVLCMPIVVFIYNKYLFKQPKKENWNKLHMFTWFCSLFLFPLVFFVGIIYSTDITRWFGHGFMTLFILVMYDMYKRKSTGFDCVNLEKNKNTFIAIAIYFVFYMSCIVEPYS